MDSNHLPPPPLEEPHGPTGGRKEAPREPKGTRENASDWLDRGKARSAAYPYIVSVQIPPRMTTPQKHILDPGKPQDAGSTLTRTSTSRGLGEGATGCQLWAQRMIWDWNFAGLSHWSQH